MDKKDIDGTPHAHLTFDALLSKLKQIERLMNIGSWSAQANTDYYELFGVDKGLQNEYKWKSEHRLSIFRWDEACEYPLPAHVGRPNNRTKARDQCNHLVTKFWLDELKLLSAMKNDELPDKTP